MIFTLWILSLATLATASNQARGKLQTYKSTANGTETTTVPSSMLLVSGAGYITTIKFNGTGFYLVSNYTITGMPSWLAFDTTNSLVYANDENSQNLSVLAYDSTTGSLKYSNSYTGSTGVVHLEFNSDKSKLLGAGYTNATVDVWDVDKATGELKKNAQLFNKNPYNPYKAGHVHQNVYGGKGRDFFVGNDLGLDSIIISANKGNGTYDILTSAQTPKGCGPRHGAIFDPNVADSTLVNTYNSSYYLVLCEDTSEILTYELTGTTLFGPVSRIPSFGVDSFPANMTTTAGGELLLIYRPTTNTTATTNGAYARGVSDVSATTSSVADVYVTNRNTGCPQDTIAHFTVEEIELPNGDTTFQLVYADYVNSSGVHPRSINFNQDGSVLFGGNVISGAGLFAFQRDPSTGTLDPTVISGVDTGQLGTGAAFVGEWVMQNKTT